MERVYSTHVESVSDLSNANLLMRFYLFERHAISTQRKLFEKKMFLFMFSEPAGEG